MFLDLCRFVPVRPSASDLSALREIACDLGADRVLAWIAALAHADETLPPACPRSEAVRAPQNFLGLMPPPACARTTAALFALANRERQRPIVQDPLDD